MLRYIGIYRVFVCKIDWLGFDVCIFVYVYIFVSVNDEFGDYLEIIVNRNFFVYGF